MSHSFAEYIYLVFNQVDSKPIRSYDNRRHAEEYISSLQNPQDFQIIPIVYYTD